MGIKRGWVARTTRLLVQIAVMVQLPPCAFEIMQRYNKTCYECLWLYFLMPRVLFVLFLSCAYLVHTFSETEVGADMVVIFV